MPLVVTPGDATADSYASVAQADAWHVGRGNAAWAALTETAKETALRRATTWIDATYGSRFGALPVYPRVQALAWPRTGATDADGYAVPSDAIPVEIVRAASEAALREALTPGSLSPDYVASAAVVREKVGPLEVEYRGSSGASSVSPVLTVVDGLLAPLLGRNSRGGMRMLVRA